MKWQKFKSLEDLKKEYKLLKELRKEIKREFPDIEIKANTWKNAWIFVKNINDFLEKELLIFTFLKVDNPSRAKIIGLDDKILFNKDERKKWKRKIAKIIAPDKNNNSKESNEAMKKFNEICEEVDADE